MADEPWKEFQEGPWKEFQQPAVPSSPGTAQPRISPEERAKKMAEISAGMRVPLGTRMLEGVLGVAEPVVRTIANIPAAIVNTPSYIAGLGQQLAGQTPSPLPFKLATHEDPYVRPQFGSVVQVPENANVVPSVRPYVEGVAQSIDAMAHDPTLVMTAPLMGAEAFGVKAAAGRAMGGAMAVQAPEAIREHIANVEQNPLISDKDKQRARGALGLNLLMSAGGALGLREPSAPRFTPEEAKQIGGETGGLLFTKDIEELQGRIPLERRLVGPRGEYQVTPEGTVGDVGQMSPKELAEFQRLGQAESRQTESGQARVVNTIAAGLEKPANVKAAIEAQTRIGEKPVTTKAASDIIFREQWEKLSNQRWASPKEEYGPQGQLTQTQQLKLDAFGRYLEKEKPDVLQRLRASLGNVQPRFPYDQKFLGMLDERLGRIPTQQQKLLKGPEDALRELRAGNLPEKTPPGDISQVGSEVRQGAETQGFAQKAKESEVIQSGQAKTEEEKGAVLGSKGLGPQLAPLSSKEPDPEKFPILHAVYKRMPFDTASSILSGNLTGRGAAALIAQHMRQTIKGNINTVELASSLEKEQKEFSKLAPQQAPLPEPPTFSTVVEDELRQKDRPFGMTPDKEGTLPVPGLVQRIKAQAGAGEWSMLQESGIEQFLQGKQRIGAKELAQWVQDNGPRVEVRKMGEGASLPEQKELNQLIHSFVDNLPMATQSALGAYQRGDISRQSLVDVFHLKPEELTKADRYKKLLETISKNPNRPMQEASWQSIAPKPESEMPGYVEGAVVRPYNKELENLSAVERGPRGREYRESLQPGVKFPSTHSFPPNTLAWFRGYMEKMPNGKKVFRVIEVQSDWARSLSNIKEGLRQGAGGHELTQMESQNALRKQNDPRLEHYESLALKAAIDHAIKEGADYIAVDDAETAMMTEGHDRAMSETRAFGATAQQAIRSLREEGWDGGRNPIATQIGHNEWIVKGQIHQEPGMRAAYDVRLPNILKKITGAEGSKQEFGEHKMAMQSPREADLEQARGEGTMTEDEIQAELRRRSIRPDLIFRNPDGTPKTTSTANVFPLSKIAETRKTKSFSQFGRLTTQFPLSEGGVPKLDIKPGATAADLLAQVAANPSVHGRQRSALAQWLLDRFPVLLSASVDKGPHPELGDAAYEPSNHTIYMDATGSGSDHGAAILHEAAHAATVWAHELPRTAEQVAAKAEVDRLMQHATDQLPSYAKDFFDRNFKPAMERRQQGEHIEPANMEQEMRTAGLDYNDWNHILYGLTSPKEFMAMVFNSEKFRTFLNRIQDTKGATLLERVWTSFKKLLGIKPGSVLEKTFDAIEGLSADETVPSQLTENIPPQQFPMLDRLKRERDAFKDWWERRGLLGQGIPAKWDAVDNKAKIAARQVANDLSDRLQQAIGAKPTTLDKEALSMAVEAKGDKTALDQFAQVERLKAPSERAKAIWDRLQPVVNFYNKVGRYQVAQENAAGIPTELREGYVPHAADVSDENALLFERSGGGEPSSGYTKERVFDTFAEGLTAGTKYKSLDSVDLLENRLVAGQRRINRQKFVDSLKSMNDPSTGKPIITNLELRKTKGGQGKVQTTTPKGYEPLHIGNDTVAVHRGYVGLLETLSSESGFNRSVIGRLAMQGTGTLKHSVLLFDLYHPIRLWFYTAPLRGMDSFKSATKKGLFTLDYNKPTLERMAARGEIDPKMLPEIYRKKQVMGVALRTGYNVGRISDALYSEAIRKVPFIGTYNKWLFEKFQRGLMMETYDIEFQRVARENPKLSEDEVGARVSKDLNTRFGNLQSQSWLKSKTGTDLLRLLFLAPQWNEGLIRSELGALKQGARVPFDSLQARRLVQGTLAKDVSGILAAYFLANQAINLLTRGHPTWDNKDDYPGAKISAWVPDPQGKGPGLWLNPLALAGEISKQLVDKITKTKSMFEGMEDVARGKLSPVGRGLNVLLTGEDWRKNHLSDWDRIKEAGKESLPLPTQFPAVKAAMTGKESYPGEAFKTGLSTLGVKTDLATPSFRERRDTASQVKYGKPFDQLSVTQRALLEKTLPKPELDDRAQEAGAKRAIEHEFEIKRRVKESLPSDIQEWLTKEKLDLPGVQDSLTTLKSKARLTDAETDAFLKDVGAEYERMIRKLMDDPKFEKKMRDAKQVQLTQWLNAAKNRARARLRSSLGKQP